MQGPRRTVQKRSRRALTSALLVSLIVLPCAAVFASQDLFEGQLGSWLSTEVQPELTSLLGEHPRFHGERVKVVAMQNGVPTVESNELTRAIRDQLTHSLTRVKGVQLVWGESHAGCGIPKRTPYLLGVEVLSEGRNKYLARIAMVDVEEGVFVSGAHMQWRGALTPDEQDAVKLLVVDAAEGTIDKPLPARSRDALVQHLVQGIQCTLKDGVEGDVFVVAADDADPALVSAAAKLRERLLQNAWLSVADTAEDADWTLELSRVADIQHSVVATLTDGVAGGVAGPGSDRSTQRLAEIYVQQSATASSAAAQIARQTKPGQPRTGQSESIQPRAAASVIDNIHPLTARAGDHCYASSANCVEVEFDMSQPGYLLVLRTGRDGSLNLGQCAAPRKTEGTKRFRLRGLSDSGFYALGTTKRALALKLHAQLKEAAVNCAARGTPSVHSEFNSRSVKRFNDRWLARLSQLVEGEPEGLDWKSFYVLPQEVSAVAQAQESTQHSRRAPR